MTITAETETGGSYLVSTPAELERIVQRVGAKNRYVVVTREDRAGFAQTHLEDPASTLLVEYRGSRRSLLHRAHLPREQAAQVLIGWAFDRPGWRRGIRWESDRVEQHIDLWTRCAFTPTADGVTCRLAGTAPSGMEWVWAVTAEGPDEQAAYTEWRTRQAVSANTAEPSDRIAWGRLLGSWVVTGAPPGRPKLSAEQRARIDASSPASWTGVPES